MYGGMQIINQGTQNGYVNVIVEIQLSLMGIASDHTTLKVVVAIKKNKLEKATLKIKQSTAKQKQGYIQYGII